MLRGELAGGYIAVRHEKLISMYRSVKECTDPLALLFTQPQHFFENYKALALGKWVKMGRGEAQMKRSRRFANQWLPISQNNRLLRILMVSNRPMKAWSF